MYSSYYPSVNNNTINMFLLLVPDLKNCIYNVALINVTFIKRAQCTIDNVHSTVDGRRLQCVLGQDVLLEQGLVDVGELRFYFVIADKSFTHTH